MKTRQFLCFASIIFLVASTGVLAATEETQNSDKENILQLERQWCEAYVKGDTAFLKRIMTDDFTLTNTRGEISSPEDEIKEISTGKTKYEIFRNHDMKVRIYGDTAIVIGGTTLKGVSEGKPYAAEVMFTDTFTRMNGEWRAVAGHASKSPK